MPNPFPGMNPWLEAVGVWEGLHLQFMGKLSDELNHSLPDDFFSRTGLRLYVVENERPIYPDVGLVRRRAPEGNGSRATGVLESDPPHVLTAEPVEVREPFVEIVLASKDQQIVATIEVLSPRNKTAGHDGRELYLKKQQELLSSRSHLIEIDLLRRGPLTVAAPESLLAEFGPWHYVVSLHWAGDGDRYEAWSRTVEQRLPRFRVPLSGDYEDVVVDLQVVLDETYEAGAFHKQIDYADDPPPPSFNASELNWIDVCLREAGVRD